MIEEVTPRRENGYLTIDLLNLQIALKHEIKLSYSPERRACQNN